MLVLTRRLGEEIRIGDDIRIVVVAIDKGRVRLGIDAPKSTKILRTELIDTDDVAFHRGFDQPEKVPA